MRLLIITRVSNFFFKVKKMTLVQLRERKMEKLLSIHAYKIWRKTIFRALNNKLSKKQVLKKLYNLSLLQFLLDFIMIELQK